MAARFLRLTAVLLLAPGLTACSGTGPSTDASPAAAPSSDVSSTVPSPSPAGEEPLSGSGYSFVLPDGWRDATEQFREHREVIDAGAVNGDQAGEAFSDNVNVLRNADQDRLPPAQEEHQFLEELRTVVDRVRLRPSITVDGVAAMRLTGRTVAGEVTALIDQYIAFVAGTYFVVTFSHSAETPRTQREGEVASVLGSWTWDRPAAQRSP